MANTVQHATFIICVLDLFHLDHLSLFQHLHGIETVIMFRLHEVDATEASGSESALQRKVILGVFASCGAFLLRLRLSLPLLRLLVLVLALRLLLVGMLLLSPRIRRGVYDIIDAGGIV